jgi:cytochrome P450
VFDVSDPGFVADPYPAYAALRANDPVERISLADGSKAWIVTRHADVRAAFADPRLQMNRELSNDESRKGLSLPSAMAVTLATSDPPVHTRLRRLVSAAFTPRRVEKLRPAVARIADGLLDAVADEGACDLAAAFARPMPVLVFRELFGIPAEDGTEVFDWAASLIVPTSENRELRAKALASIGGYVRDLVRRKQKEPCDDLLSALIEARDVHERLDENELTTMVVLLMASGSQTTTHLIGNSVLTLLREPARAAAVAGRPDLVPAVVEEVLRYEGPVSLSARRFASEDMVIAGTSIARGDTVYLGLGAANRDDEVFADAGGFDPDRPDLGRHMGFGHGIHHCLGAGLARLEGEVALAALLRRLPGLALAIRVEDLRWQDNLNVRGVHELPVTWDRSNAARPER